MFRGVNAGSTCPAARVTPRSPPPAALAHPHAPTHARLHPHGRLLVSLLLPRDSALRSCARAAVERGLAAIFTVGHDLREHARFVGAALALAAALLAGGLLPGAANAAGKVPK